MKSSQDMPLRWIKVQWDHGEKKSYRVGAEGKHLGQEVADPRASTGFRASGSSAQMPELCSPEHVRKSR